MHKDGQPLTVTVDAAHAGQRVDEALASLLGVSINAIKRLCGQQRVLRRGTRLRKGESVKAGDVVTLLAPPVEETPVPELPTLFRNARFVVVDKPAGMASHKLRPDEPPSALDAVVALWPAVAMAGPDPREGGLLHRLDLGTSGALAFALEPRAFEEGREAFRLGGARKLYVALVSGDIPARGFVDAPVAHDPGDPRRSVTVAAQDTRHRGKPRQAITHFRTLFRRGQDALVLVDGEGGRRHQVRVHMAHAGAPLWGDDLYAGPSWPAQPRLPTHALHAVWLRFEAGDDVVVATAPAPQAFHAVTRHVLGEDGERALSTVERDPLGAWD
jgi:23S rRNA pseudouridine1911/1915/1917 synthase